MTQPQPSERNVDLTASGERSAAVHTNQGTIITGDVRPPVDLPAAADVRPPPALHNLPSTAAPFVGREDELCALAAAVALAGNAVSQVVTQAVAGLGGIGKSTLALHHARTHRDNHTLTWWVVADRPETSTASLAQLARQLLEGRNTRDFTDEQRVCCRFG